MMRVLFKRFRGIDFFLKMQSCCSLDEPSLSPLSKFCKTLYGFVSCSLACLQCTELEGGRYQAGGYVSSTATKKLQEHIPAHVSETRIIAAYRISLNLKLLCSEEGLLGIFQMEYVVHIICIKFRIFSDSK